jgi:hypothetical protein
VVPPCSDRISRVPPYSRTPKKLYPYGAITRYGRPFQSRSGCFSRVTGLVRVRSPLLAESRLMSFPPGTEMFQFPGFASRTYVFSAQYGKSRGLPHSEIPGSKSARNSPGLIAACYVLHRLSVPRHPSNALFILHSLTAVRSEQSNSVLDLCRSATPSGGRIGPIFHSLRADDVFRKDVLLPTRPSSPC